MVLLISLTFVIHLFVQVYPGDLALNFAGFPNLKYLELKVFAEQYNDDTLVACMCLAQGCPSLLELKLKVTSCTGVSTTALILLYISIYKESTNYGFTGNMGTLEGGMEVQ